MEDQEKLPEDIEKILEAIAGWAKAYDNHLKWNEVAKLKSDMMRRMDRWRLVSPTQVELRCLELGMTANDAGIVSEMLEKRQAGRRLIPESSYRNFEFKHGR